jgi:hypothetical protein
MLQVLLVDSPKTECTAKTISSSWHNVLLYRLLLCKMLERGVPLKPSQYLFGTKAILPLAMLSNSLVEGSLALK